MDAIYGPMDSTWDDRAAIEGLLKKHLLVITGLFFLWSLFSFPTEEFPKHLLGRWAVRGVREWGVPLVAGVGTGAKCPHSWHHSLNCPYFSPSSPFSPLG